MTEAIGRLAVTLEALSPIVQGKTVTIQIPVQPTRANIIDERSYTVDLPPDTKIIGVRTFLGVDQGNNGEYAMDLLTFQGRLYSRSMHKEATFTYYEAWEKVVLPSVWTASTLYIHTLAHQTVPMTGNVQFEIVLERA